MLVVTLATAKTVSKRWTTCCWHHKSGWRCRPQSTAWRYFSNRLNHIL